MKRLAGGFAGALFAVSGGVVQADVVINEALGSTTGADNEYIELYNTGPGSVDVSGWLVELWDSDAGASFGIADADSPYRAGEGAVLEPGEYYLFANQLAQDAFGAAADVLLPSNAIENSSYTMVLRDAAGTLVDSVFVTDGGSGDAANVAGTAIVPGATVGPDGTFLPAGFYRTEPGSATLALLEFSPQPSPSGTPESSNAVPPEEPEPVAIGVIQGEGHTSPLLGESVVTAGVVTAVDSNGFYVQDPEGDGNDATSDALFVFTGGAPGVAVGNLVTLSGTVSEFTPGGASTGNLSTTQMAFPDVEVTGAAPLPAPVVLGIGGRLPPTENIDDDAFASFDPITDGIDYFEAVEAMRVRVPAPLAASPTNRFGELFVVADGGVGATGVSLRQTLNISPDDFNPERIQIDEDTGILPDFRLPEANAGAMLSDVTGVVSYDFGNFQIHPTEPFEVTPSALVPALGSIQGRGDRLTLASYNVLNLDPRVEDQANVVRNDPDEIDDDVGLGRFDAIASHIVTNLGAPDIIGLQEVQDNDGAEVTDVASADETLQTLVDAIAAAGGPEYAYLDTPGLVPAFFDGSNAVSPVGGQPGGNIRAAFLYNPKRVALAGEAEPLTDPADQAVNPDNPFYRSRISLVARFEFNGRTVTVVNNHLSSKGGSAPIFGVEQPFEARQEDPSVNGSLDERQAQAQAVRAYVDGLLAADPAARVVVLGDMNEFEFVSPVSEILGGVLVNPALGLDANERYSYVFQGNSQQLDHLLLSPSLAGAAEFEVVHVNAEFAETATRASDHDPVLAGVFVPYLADLDADGEVDADDLQRFFRALGSREGWRRYDPVADLDGDGRVGFFDLKRFLASLRESFAGH